MNPRKIQKSIIAEWHKNLQDKSVHRNMEWFFLYFEPDALATVEPELTELYRAFTSSWPNSQYFPPLHKIRNVAELCESFKTGLKRLTQGIRPSIRAPTTYSAPMPVYEPEGVYTGPTDDSSDETMWHETAWGDPDDVARQVEEMCGTRQRFITDYMIPVAMSSDQELQNARRRRRKYRRALKARRVLGLTDDEFMRGEA